MSKRTGESARNEFVAEVRSRLIGPSTADEELREKPSKRYLTGMVFPKGASTAGAVRDEEELGDDISDDDEDPEIESPMDMLFQKLPASVGITFAIAPDEQSIRVEVSAGRYEHVAAEVVAEQNAKGRAVFDLKPAHRQPRVWKRVSIVEGDQDEVVELSAASDGTQTRIVLDSRARIHLLIRRAGGVRIATLSLVSESETEEDAPVRVEDILFQVRLTCIPSQGVQAYPDAPTISEDLEAEELALQYRELPTFAVGHGCGVAWENSVDGIVESVSIDYLPSVEVPPVTTEIESLPGEVKEALSLCRLQDPQFNPLPAFESFVSVYEQWADQLTQRTVPERFAQPRERVLSRLDLVVRRMRGGIQLLRTSPLALEIFRTANRAMLLSLARTAANRDRTPGLPYKDVDIGSLDPKDYQWRPFQLAFFLISLQGLWDPQHDDRAIVDLIWFPTGGGKTEAYLAVAAFEMLRRRIVDGEAGLGTAVIKRYTLRLLTIQQFERAGSLICALETFRRRGALSGESPFSLGLWVGKDSSPNSNKDALADLTKILSTIGKVEGVKVPLKNCPACGTSILPVAKDEGSSGIGIRREGDGIKLCCVNAACSFHDALPISFVDDHLYKHPPTMLLGTVDKFAMLAWREEARAFFGTDQKVAPPSLIIQDELHLISGPLGTLAGVYEAAIDTIIARLGPSPKYICATATIRRADDQIEKLYGRQSALFPPPGLDASDSFFSRTDSSSPGRLYLGAMGQGHTPTFSNVVASTALLAAGGIMRDRFDALADTWWTLVVYHNSKRELGKTLSLARDDIPARLGALGEARKIAGARVRELSANLRDSEIPESLHQLSIGLPDPGALDFVACTNMLSVGVDVQRLGLMMINGQPKTVSEYIQASSRVGRDRRRPPGVVFALFSPSKPRDRSHYEYFRAFHKAYYRHVEPTSVTPFSVPSQERGLHGAFLALVRMSSTIYKNNHAAAITTKASEIEALAEEFLARIARAKDGDAIETRERLEGFLSFWAQRARERSSNLRFQADGKEHARLIRPFRDSRVEGWETLQSLRHVDTPLRLEVSMVAAGAGVVQA